MNRFNIIDFVKILQETKSENLFNPYTDLCMENDTLNAPIIRTQNLMRYLEKTLDAKIMFIGEAPGYLGCRRTGLPFTDERHLKQAGDFLGTIFQKATDGGKDKETSALHVWEVMKEVTEIPFIWNIVPMHPFEKEGCIKQEHNEPCQLTNRTPNKKDFDANMKAIEYLMDTRDFDIIYAIGNKAFDKLTEMGYKHIKKVRHPSHGGSNIFKDTMRKSLGIKPKETLGSLDDFF
ncbi:hypothetical protein LCGC14_1032390 [marine sediment metagenome]|uniref:Uracil-DNA glycosylase-like domain-containing protein n=1 Tax=marine sediment metagenome TaxID=412755 RepID=A0A0F9R089_9ZZZZ